MSVEEFLTQGPNKIYNLGSNVRFMSVCLTGIFRRTDESRKAGDCSNSFLLFC
jgi:hypothetical protein